MGIAGEVDEVEIEVSADEVAVGKNEDLELMKRKGGAGNDGGDTAKEEKSKEGKEMREVESSTRRLSFQNKEEIART